VIGAIASREIATTSKHAKPDTYYASHTSRFFALRDYLKRVTTAYDREFFWGSGGLLGPDWISDMARAVVKTEIIIDGGIYAG